MQCAVGRMHGETNHITFYLENRMGAIVLNSTVDLKNLKFVNRIKLL